MQNTIISTGVGILLFLCMLLGFRIGLRWGMQTARGQIPPKIEPIKKAMQGVKDPPPDAFVDNLLKGHANMMAHDGFLPEERR